MNVKSNISLYKPDNKSFELSPFKESIKATGYGSFGSPALDFPEDKIDLKFVLIYDMKLRFT